MLPNRIMWCLILLGFLHFWFFWFSAFWFFLVFCCFDLNKSSVQVKLPTYLWFYFVRRQSFIANLFIIKFLLITGYEQWTSGIGSGHSDHWVTTTILFTQTFPLAAQQRGRIFFTLAVKRSFLLKAFKNKTVRAVVVVVKWSACLPSIQQIEFESRRRLQFFSVKFVCEKNVKKQKEARVGTFINK